MTSPTIIVSCIDGETTMKMALPNIVGVFPLLSEKAKDRTKAKAIKRKRYGIMLRAFLIIVFMFTPEKWSLLRLLYAVFGYPVEKS